jgi:hypothetical protein
MLKDLFWCPHQDPTELIVLTSFEFQNEPMAEAFGVEVTSFCSVRGV